jgi:hypothetical protein
MAGSARGELVALHGELADELGQSAVVRVPAGDQTRSEATASWASSRSVYRSR